MTLSLKPFDRGKARTPEQAMDDIRQYVPQERAETNSIINEMDFGNDIKIIETAYEYVLHNVSWMLGGYNIEWSKELLDSGNEHTQERWSRMGHSIPCLPTYTITFLTLLDCYNRGTDKQKESIEGIKSMFQTDFIMRVMTSTKVEYRENNPDLIIHQRINQSGHVELPGERNFLEKLTEDDGLEYLLFDDNLARVAKAYSWIAGKECFILRPTRKQYMSQVVAMQKSKDRFYINAEHDPETKGIARYAALHKL